MYSEKKNKEANVHLINKWIVTKYDMNERGVRVAATCTSNPLRAERVYQKQFSPTNKSFF